MLPSLFFVLSVAALCDDPSVLSVVTVSNRGDDLEEAVVSFRREEFPKGARLVDGVEKFPLERTKNKIIPTQFDPQTNLVYWVIPGITRKGEDRKFRILSGESSDQPDTPEKLQAQSDEKEIRVKWGDKDILKYHKAKSQVPEGVDPIFSRSAHIHPFFSPDGVAVTDEYPPDHLHQSGLFLAYRKAIFKEKPVNFWEVQERTGRVEFAKENALEEGPVSAGFSVLHHHLAIIDGVESLALKETWTIRVRVSSEEPRIYLIDLTSRREIPENNSLQLTEYHYGGMALRGARGWLPGNSEFLTSLGHSRENGNHTRPNWTNLSGELNGKLAGISLMTHPDNFRYPEPVRIHPTMPYFVATPSQLGDWQIEPDRPHTSHYRFLVQDGPVDRARWDRIWNGFSHPPELKVDPVRNN